MDSAVTHTVCLFTVPTGCLVAFTTLHGWFSSPHTHTFITGLVLRFPCSCLRHHTTFLPLQLGSATTFTRSLDCVTVPLPHALPRFTAHYTHTFCLRIACGCGYTVTVTLPVPHRGSAVVQVTARIAPRFTFTFARVTFTFTGFILDCGSTHITGYGWLGYALRYAYCCLLPPQHLVTTYTVTVPAHLCTLRYGYHFGSCRSTLPVGYPVLTFTVIRLLRFVRLRLYRCGYAHCRFTRLPLVCYVTHVTHAHSAHLRFTFYWLVLRLRLHTRLPRGSAGLPHVWLGCLYLVYLPATWFLFCVLPAYARFCVAVMPAFLVTHPHTHLVRSSRYVGSLHVARLLVGCLIYTLRLRLRFTARLIATPHRVYIHRYHTVVPGLPAVLHYVACLHAVAVRSHYLVTYAVLLSRVPPAVPHLPPDHTRLPSVRSPRLLDYRSGSVTHGLYIARLLRLPPVTFGCVLVATFACGYTAGCTVYTVHCHRAVVTLRTTGCRTTRLNAFITHAAHLPLPCGSPPFPCTIHLYCVLVVYTVHYHITCCRLRAPGCTVTCGCG